MNCPSCGTKSRGSFCSECGAKLEKNTTAINIHPVLEKEIPKKLVLFGVILYVLVYVSLDLFTPADVAIEYVTKFGLCLSGTGLYSEIYFISPIIIAVIVGLSLHKWGKSSISPLIPSFSIQAGVLGLFVVSLILDVFELRRNIFYTAKVVEYIILYIALFILYILPERRVLYPLCFYHLFVVLFLMNCLFGAIYNFSSALVPSISIRATAIPLLLLGWHNYKKQIQKL